MFLGSQEKLVAAGGLGVYPVRADRYACTICGREKTVTSPLNQRPLVAPPGWWYNPWWRDLSSGGMSVELLAGRANMLSPFHEIIQIRICSEDCRGKFLWSPSTRFWEAGVCDSNRAGDWLLNRVAEKTVDDAVIRICEPLKVWGHRDRKGRELQVAGGWDVGSLDESTVDDAVVLNENEVALLIRQHASSDVYKETAERNRKGKWRRRRRRRGYDNG